MISKDWMLEQLQIYKEKLDNASDGYEVERYQGVVFGLKLAYQKLIESTKSKETKEKQFDYEKTFKKVLKFYLDKGEDPKKANDMAIRVAEQQRQEWEARNQ